MTAKPSIRILAAKMLVTTCFFAAATSGIAATNGNYKDWTWLEIEGGAVASTDSSKYSETGVGVAFFADQDCNPRLLYSIQIPDGTEVTEGPVDIRFQMRIDEREILNIDPGSTFGMVTKADGETDWYHYTMAIPPALLKDLVHGYTMRVREIGSDITDRFSLLGSARAMRDAYQVCEREVGHSNDPDLKYFSADANGERGERKESDPDRDYFESSQANERRPMDKDGDRAFFE